MFKVLDQIKDGSGWLGKWRRKSVKGLDRNGGSVQSVMEESI